MIRLSTCTMSNLESNMFYAFVIVSCIIIPIIDAFQVRKIQARHDSAHDNKFHDDNAVGIYSVKSKILCLVECAKDLRCISFFFNGLTEECILHSDPFVYTDMEKSGTGWKFYLLRYRKFVIFSCFLFKHLYFLLIRK